ncbi:hypothetical protein [Caminibacter sp.]
MRKEEILKELNEIKKRKEELEKELEEIKAQESGFKYKVILPYECSAKAYGDYVAYFKTKAEADAVMKKIKKGEALFSDAEWNVASEEITDTWNDEFIYEDAKIEKI